MHHFLLRLTLATLLSVAVGSAQAATWQARFVDPLVNGGYVEPGGVSADGSVVVGTAETLTSYFAFRWSQATGTVNLGALPGDYFSEGWAASADGSVVVGRSVGTVEGRAFRWTQATGMVELGPLPATAFAVSADGGVIVGSASFGGLTRAFRWTQTTGMVDLGALPGASQSYGFGVSSDGSVVAGWSLVGSLARAFRWTQATGMVDLGALPGASDSLGFGISADGSVVVGWSIVAGSQRAFRWTQATGMVALPSVPGETSSTAWGVSGDGSVVAGGFSVDTGTSYLLQRAFVWSAADGKQALPLPAGADSSSKVQAVSVDGKAMAGIVVKGGVLVTALWTKVEDGVVRTPTGTYVDVSTNAVLPSGSTAPVSLTFDSVASAGQTTVTTSSMGTPPPSGFKLGQPPVYYDVSTTAAFAGSVLVCFSWAEGQFHNEGALRLWHMENNIWHDVTSSVNQTTNTVCGQVTSLSPFIIAEKAYAFAGFFQPVENLPAVNGVKAGSAVPVKFSLGGNQGLNIFDAGSPRLQAVACSSGTGSVIDDAAASSSSGLTYDASTNLYTFVWKTSKSFVGSCLQLILDFNDGTQQQATFDFVR